jgi:hypothetical protein
MPRGAFEEQKMRQMHPGPHAPQEAGDRNVMQPSDIFFNFKI